MFTVIHKKQSVEVSKFPLWKIHKKYFTLYTNVCLIAQALTEIEYLWSWDSLGRNNEWSWPVSESLPPDWSLGSKRSLEITNVKSLIVGKTFFLIKMLYTAVKQFLNKWPIWSELYNWFVTGLKIFSCEVIIYCFLITGFYITCV